MATTVDWDDERRELACRICAVHADAALLGRVSAPGEDDIEIVRCDACGSIGLVDEARDTSPDDLSVDSYLEGGVGLGVIAATLTAVPPERVHRFLDVGCNYGFSLDLGRFAFGWDVLGVEPSHAALRGSVELDVPILQEYLTDDTPIDQPFDLVLASEVIEHVQDPAAFAAMLRRRLTPTGTLLLTTPAAEIVEPRRTAGRGPLGAQPLVPHRPGQPAGPARPAGRRGVRGGRRGPGTRLPPRAGQQRPHDTGAALGSRHRRPRSSRSTTASAPGRPTRARRSAAAWRSAGCAPWSAGAPSRRRRPRSRSSSTPSRCGTGSTSTTPTARARPWRPVPPRRPTWPGRRSPSACSACCTATSRTAPRSTSTSRSPPSTRGNVGTPRSTSTRSTCGSRRARTAPSPCPARNRPSPRRWP